VRFRAPLQFISWKNKKYYVKIRLKRTGRKKEAFYRIVLMENLARRDVEVLQKLDITIQ
jgi:hypothetical protein